MSEEYIFFFLYYSWTYSDLYDLFSSGYIKFYLLTFNLDRCAINLFLFRIFSFSMGLGYSPLKWFFFFFKFYRFVLLFYGMVEFSYGKNSVSNSANFFKLGFLRNYRLYRWKHDNCAFCTNIVARSNNLAKILPNDGIDEISAPTTFIFVKWKWATVCSHENW